MTLIITKTSAPFALMVTDRRLTDAHMRSLLDPDANKNILFADQNAVVAIGYTGLATVGPLPMDRWIAQTLTQLEFREGRKGKGSVPAIQGTSYQLLPWRVRLKQLKDALDDLVNSLPDHQRSTWVELPFDLVFTGFEGSKTVRPIIGALSKAPKSKIFTVDVSSRNQFSRQEKAWPTRIAAAPHGNVSDRELRSIDDRLNSVWGDGHGSPEEIFDHAERLIIEAIQEVSSGSDERSKVVGPDIMSILIPHPIAQDPRIRVTYTPTDRDKGTLVMGGGEKRTTVPISFTPWIVSPGGIVAPCILSNIQATARCGPYMVMIKGPPSDGAPGIMSSRRP